MSCFVGVTGVPSCRIEHIENSSNRELSQHMAENARSIWSVAQIAKSTEFRDVAQPLGRCPGPVVNPVPVVGSVYARWRRRQLR